MNEEYVEIGCIGNVDNAVEKLKKWEEQHPNGPKAKINFSGHWLYSDTVNAEDAWLEITGRTKAEVDAEREQWKAEREERKATDPEKEQ